MDGQKDRQTDRRDISTSRAASSQLKLKNLFIERPFYSALYCPHQPKVPTPLSAFKRINTHASSYHGSINHLGCEEEYCREYYSLKTLTASVQLIINFLPEKKLGVLRPQPLLVSVLLYLYMLAILHFVFPLCKREDLPKISSNTTALSAAKL